MRAALAVAITATAVAVGPAVASNPSNMVRADAVSSIHGDAKAQHRSHAPSTLATSDDPEPEPTPEPSPEPTPEPDQNLHQ